LVGNLWDQVKSGLSLKIRRLFPELVGLSLSYAFLITGFLNLVTRLFAEVEKSFNAVERTLHYIELKDEGPSIIENKRPKAGWPKHGNISFKNVVCTLHWWPLHYLCYLDDEI
jgi:ABC-type multidrug transport system fused ATPase/permease subunit